MITRNQLMIKDDAHQNMHSEEIPKYIVEVDSSSQVLPCMHRAAAVCREHTDISALSRQTVDDLYNLLKLAESSIGGDPEKTRLFLSSAIAMLNTLKSGDTLDASAGVAIGQDGRRLATWQRKRVCRYIEDNLSASISVNTLAAVARLSRSYFCKAFKVTFGQTPHAYLMERRVEIAKQMMISTSITLSEIAHDCGFSDQAHLCRVFRCAVGEAPHRWRQARRVEL